MKDQPLKPSKRKKIIKMTSVLVILKVVSKKVFFGSHRTNTKWIISLRSKKKKRKKEFQIRMPIILYKL